MSSKHNNTAYDTELKNQVSVIKNSIAIILDKARYGSNEKFLEHISRIDNAASKIIDELEGKRYLPTAQKYKKILVPYDGSKYSKKALTEAIDVSKKFFSKLYIVNVANVALDTPHMVMQEVVNKKLKKLTKALLESENRQANTMLQNKMKSCKEMGIDVQCDVLVGNPPYVILRFAKNHKIDLIVVGSRGLTKARKIMALGSVSRKISEESDCPVMIVR